MSARSRSGSRSVPGSVTISRPPVVSGDQNSHTDRSKVAGVFNRTVSCDPRRKVSRNHASWLTIAACEMVTPLGRPVEPEVKMT